MPVTLLYKTTARTRQPELTIGVVADTHIPDRVNDLHPEILPIFSAAGVSGILHAGDISTTRILDRLGEVAPVIAVRGNRDIFTRKLKLVEQLDLHGVSVTLLHGHGGFVPYLRDKVRFLLDGYQLSRYLDPLIQAAGPAEVIVFGHTHHAVSQQFKGKLIFNPGSASFGSGKGKLPSIGLLYFADGVVNSEIIQLRGWKIRARKWVRE